MTALSEVPTAPPGPSPRERIRVFGRHHRSTTILACMALIGAPAAAVRRAADHLGLPAPGGVDRRLLERRRVRPPRRRPQPRRRRRGPARPRLRGVLRHRLVCLRVRRLAVRQPDPRDQPPGVAGRRGGRRLLADAADRCRGRRPVRRPPRGADAAAARRLPRDRDPRVRRDRPHRVPRGGHGHQRHQRHRRHLPAVAARHRRLHRARRDPVLHDDPGHRDRRPDLRVPARQRAGSGGRGRRSARTSWRPPPTASTPSPPSCSPSPSAPRRPASPACSAPPS